MVHPVQENYQRAIAEALEEGPNRQEVGRALNVINQLDRRAAEEARLREGAAPRERKFGIIVEGRGYLLAKNYHKAMNGVLRNSVKLVVERRNVVPNVQGADLEIVPLTREEALEVNARMRNATSTLHSAAIAEGREFPIGQPGVLVQPLVI